MKLTIIFTLLALFCVGQDCPPDINNSPGNPKDTINATVYDINGGFIQVIVCDVTGNSNHIDCLLSGYNFPLGYTISIEFSSGQNKYTCTYNSEGVLETGLPVELLYFEVARVDGVDVVSWVTVSETNNNFFRLESSVDGSAWKNVGTINGSGNSQSEIKYQVRVVPNSRVTYYKLTQQDFDGKEEEFPIISSYGELNVTIVKTVNIMGQEVDESYKGLVIDIFTDNTIRKRYQ